MASFDENGKYIKTNWKAGDKITATKLNKIEESIEAVNDNDISRHVEADARLDALEAKGVAHDKEFTNVKNLIADNKAAAELGDYEINSRMTFLEEELNEGIEEVHNVASTVDGKIATAEASMASAVAQGKADMEAMVDAVEGELESKIDIAKVPLEAADTTLQNNIDVLQANLEAADTTLQNNIDALQANLEAADTTLQNNIDVLQANLEAADTTLQNNIDVLQANLEAADITLQNNIDVLQANLEAADITLQNNISEIQNDITYDITTYVDDTQRKLSYTLPGGLIIKAGTTAFCPSGSTTRIDYDTPFPTNSVSVVVTMNGGVMSANAQVGVQVIHDINGFGFTHYFGSDRTFNYIAIGY